MPECRVTKRDVEAVRDFLHKFKIIGLTKYPFYVFLLSNLRVVVTCSVPTAATDGLTLYINPVFFKNVTSKPDGNSLFAAVLVHELEHVARLHPTRFRKLVEKLGGVDPDFAMNVLNIAADAIINRDLMKNNLTLPPGAIYPNDASRILGVDVTSTTPEGVLRQVLKRLPRVQVQGGSGGQAQQHAGHQAGQPKGCSSGGQAASPTAPPAAGGGGQAQPQAGQPGAGGGRGQRQRQAGQRRGQQGGGQEDLERELGRLAEEAARRGLGTGDVLKPGSGPKDGEVAQRGSQAVEKALEEAGKGIPPDEAVKRIESAARRAVMDSYMAAKAAGRLPGHIERIVKELMKPAENWRHLIRSALKGPLGSSVRRTWSVPNRKLPGLRPGRVVRGVDEIYVLMDVSGSISDYELRRFASEVAGIASQIGAKVVVIPWDTEVKGRIIVRNRAEARKIKTTGGGGTELLPVLRQARRFIRPGRPVVILSDWYLADEASKLIRELEDLARKNELILATIGAEPPNIKRAKKVKLPA